MGGAQVRKEEESFRNKKERQQLEESFFSIQHWTKKIELTEVFSYISIMFGKESF